MKLTRVLEPRKFLQTTDLFVFAISSPQARNFCGTYFAYICETYFFGNSYILARSGTRWCRRAARVVGNSNARDAESSADEFRDNIYLQNYLRYTQINWINVFKNIYNFLGATNIPISSELWVKWYEKWIWTDQCRFHDSNNNKIKNSSKKNSSTKLMWVLLFSTKIATRNRTSIAWGLMWMTLFVGQSLLGHL